MRDERSRRDGGHKPEDRSAPLWVKVFGAVTLAVVLLFLILLLVGSGHGPGRHAASGADGQTQA